MKKINRQEFLKNSLQTAFVIYSPLPKFLMAGFTRQPADTDPLFKRLLIANDKQVDALLQTDWSTQKFSRKTGFDFASLSAAYVSPGSRYFQKQQVLLALQKITQQLLEVQAADGTVNIGNLESPPDTAFLLEPLTAAASILRKSKSKNSATVVAGLQQFLLKAGDALAIGGVHTPNHRWVVCAALARLNALYPNQNYSDRIHQWMEEGIFIDQDGNFPERSRNYAAVEDTSLITMARLLNKAVLLEPVRKNLETTYYYMDPDGNLATVDSRRQDQWGEKNILDYYLQYRYMALHDKNPFFSAVAKMMETFEGFEKEVVNRFYFHFLEDPLLQNQLPPATTLSVSYEKFFTEAHLLRVRRGEKTVTLFGGVDWPLIIASGRSNSPNFFSFRKGKAVLNYLRLSTNFFSTGYFYSEGVKKEGNRYLLHRKLDVPYYQPLPKEFQRSDGDYKLSPSIDDRFWNKMDFEHRPVSNVKSLDTTVSFAEVDGKNEVAFEISGQPGVQVTIELCFKEGGNLKGVSDGSNENVFLETGIGKYEYAGDEIEFGPGVVQHRNINGLEGERYSTHFGSLRTEGMHVYLTGITPFKHKLIFS